MNLFAGYGMKAHQPPPFINSIDIRQTNDRSFQTSQNSFDLSCREAQSIVISRTCTDRPELDEILRSYANAVAFFDESVQTSLRYAMLRITAMNPPEQNICVRKDVDALTGSVPVVFTSVDALSAESLVREGRSALWNHVRDFFESFLELFDAQMRRNALVNFCGNDLQDCPP